MPKTNKEIIEKAFMSLASLSTAGQLNPEQSRTFIQMLVDQPTILREARTVSFVGDSKKIEKIGIGSRILRPAQEGTALAEDQKFVPTTSKVTLTTKEVIAEINISDDTIENNIETTSIEDTIMNLIAQRAALDIEELLINGDVALVGTDPYLGMLDGLRKKAISHVVNAESLAISSTLLKNAKKAMPAKYKRAGKMMQIYTSDSVETEWIDLMGNRQTAAGDNAITTGNVPLAYGVPVKGIAMLAPYDNGAGVDVSDAIMTIPKNIVIGVSRDIRIETDRDIRARMNIIVLTMKLDVAFEEEDAVVKIIKIKE
jgi:hypothetical protein